MALIKKDLFGHGPTPWQALKELTIAAHATRDQTAMHLADGEVTVRLIKVSQTVASEGMWIAEATWQIKG